MNKIFPALLILQFSLLLHAQNSLTNSINKILSKLPAGTSSSVFVYDPLANDTLFAKNIDKRLIPASNVKLFTTAALLNYFGEDFEVATSFLSDDQNDEDGIIDGNLYIKGMGDPSLNTNIIDSIIVALKEKGLTKISGDIIVDESVFDSIYTRDDWITDEKANVILPPISGLIVNRSTVRANIFKGNGDNSSIDYEVTPNYDFITVTLESKTKSKRNNFESELFQNEEGIELLLRYNSNKKFKRKYFYRFAKNPDMFFGFVVKSELELNGISVSGKVRKGKTTPDLHKIIDIITPIENLLQFTNKDSNNFYAECLFKLLGWVFSSNIGNSFYATQAVINYLNEWDIPTDNLDIVDGSGISRYNKVTTSAIVSLLTHLYFDEEVFPVYYNSLSIAGVDGTLKDRFSSGKISNHFRGKTGTLNGVCSLSGYLSTTENTDLIVSILFEFNQNGANYYRAIQDEIIELLVGL